jgi:hypothetical protein
MPAPRDGVAAPARPIGLPPSAPPGGTCQGRACGARGPARAGQPGQRERVLTPDTMPAGGVARMRSTASCSSAHCRASRPYLPVSPRSPHPTDGEALWAGGAPPHTRSARCDGCTDCRCRGGPWRGCQLASASAHPLHDWSSRGAGAPCGYRPPFAFPSDAPASPRRAQGRKAASAWRRGAVKAHTRLGERTHCPSAVSPAAALSRCDLPPTHRSTISLLCCALVFARLGQRGER